MPSKATISRIPLHGEPQTKIRGHSSTHLTARDMRRVLLFVLKNEGCTLKEILRNLGLRVSLATLCRAVLAHPELRRSVPPVARGLLARHKVRRVSWAEAELAASRDWTQVIYVDETQLRCDGSSKPHKVLHSTRRPITPARKRVHGGGVVNLIVAIGPGNFVAYERIEKGLSADKYARFLEGHVVGHATEIMHDNYKVHHAQLVKDVLEANGIVEVEQPALSPTCSRSKTFSVSSRVSCTRATGRSTPPGS